MTQACGFTVENASCNGAISFFLGAVFLLSALYAGLAICSSKPDYSYEEYRAAMLAEVAIKSAFYSSLSEAVREEEGNFHYSDAAGTPAAFGPFGAHGAVVAAAHARALEFERQLKGLGYDAVFWCGSPSERERVLASGEMMQGGKAVIPYGALPLPECRDSFSADLLGGKLHLSNLGFSIYHEGARIGRAVVFPSSYEVDFQ